MRQAVTEQRIREIYNETLEAFYAGVARRCGGDRALAEDVVQESWMRAVREWRTKGLPASPLAWLTTVGRNLLFNEFRRRHAASLSELDENDVSHVAAAVTVDESPIAAEELARALERLPANQHALLRAFHLDGRRISQIAETMGISERAVEGRLNRARQNLRNQIELSPCSSEDV